MEHWASIQTSPVAARLDTGKPNPDFCERSTWKLMVAVTVIYSLVLIFRVLTFIDSLVTDRRRTMKEGEGARRRRWSRPRGERWRGVARW